LALLKGTAILREVVLRVQIRVPEELKEIAVQRVASGFGDDVNLSPTVPAVLGIEVVHQNPKLCDGIEIRDDRGSQAAVFLGVRPIHYISISRFALAID
jgi:hypothetical protein